MDLSRDIAIVGMGGIFPGAGEVAQFWSQVLAGRSQSREVPPGRWPLTPADAYDPSIAPPRPDKTYSTRGCFVDPFTCDLAGLDISRAQLDRLDPMFHLLLHAGKAAWRDTVTRNAAPDRTGVIIGNIVLPTDASSAITDEIFGPLFAEKALGRRVDDFHSTDPLNRYVAGLPAGVLAKALGLGGRAFTLDAACASSLYAVKLAVEELRSRRADLMLTGGLSRPDCFYTQMGFSQLRALSPSGRCAPFDAGADGLIVGEGAGIVALKRLDDALRDRDHIYATIAGIGLSNDIAGNLMQPDSSGQLRAMRAAYQQAGWSPHQIDLIECHGTGTPVGDAVEFTSLTRLWGSNSRNARCVIGSVKSNVGHLLTAAGAAGMIKVLLAMRDRKLPPTANFSGPAPGIALGPSPFAILREAADWPRPGGHARRAAVSGFGFGGINAHLLVEEWEPAAVRTSVSVPAQLPAAAAQPPIAIVGMAAHFGPWQNLAAVRKRFYGRDHILPTSPRDWRGAAESGRFTGFFIDEVRIPKGRFRIPPAELSEMLPQQLLMLQVAADALGDAGLARNPPERLDTGVYIGIGLDLNTTNFRFRWTLQEKARRWARDLGLAPTQLDPWVGQLRAAAGPALNANRTMGALGGIVASRVARAFHVGGPSFTVSSEETSGLDALNVGVGALQRGEIDVALVGAVDLAGDLRAVLCQDALRPFGDRPVGEGAAALVLKRHGDALRDGDRIYALLHDSPSTEKALDGHPVAFESPELGDAGVASGLASVIKAALALHHETLPPAKGNPPQYWLRDRARGPRCAAVSSRSIAGTSTLVFLQDAPAAPSSPIEPGECLFALAAPDAAGLQAALSQLESRAEDTPLPVLAREWFESHRPAGRLMNLALIADAPDQLRALLAEARTAIRQGRSSQGDRLFFNPTPSAAGQIAFVYPGSGTHFPGMGRDLAVQFPQVLHRQDAENLHLAAQFASARCWADASLSARDAIFAHVSLGAFITDLLGDFGLAPHAAIGYSLGESTALFATRTWRVRDEMLARMHASTLFTSDLTGSCDAAKQAWNLPANETVDWLMGVINRPVDIVRQNLRGRQRVYLLIVNTPDECVIGGDRSAVESLIRNLDARFHPLQGVTTVHCEVARPVESAYRDLHLLDTTPPAGVRFYSGALGASYQVTRESAADAIVRQAVAPFDFTRVIRTAYADGVRTFIEVGPGATCTRMIDQILLDQPHLARSACIAGQDNVGTLLRLLALLHAQGVPIDFSPLYAHVASDQIAAASPSIAVRTGADPFHVPPPPKPAAYPPPAPRPVDTEPARAIESRSLHPMLHQVATTHAAQARAQETFLRLSLSNTRALSDALSFQLSLLSTAGTAILESPGESPLHPEAHQPPILTPASPPRALGRDDCLAFATGKLASVLGDSFAHVDSYPTRVRLPDEPLMLVDRIVAIEGTPHSMTHGRVITEHDIHPGAWYLDANRIPTCIAVEAGQADLFLSSYLGIDSITKGQAVYRLLDAVVTFHAPLPTPGATIVYDIAIEHFFRQGDTHLFRFHFEATLDGKPFLSMQKGCAGFFTDAELAAGKGIVQTSIDKRPLPGKRPDDWGDLVPMTVESYSDEQLTALRRGNLAACFGPRFDNLLSNPSTLPSGRMTLVHRILNLDPAAGRYGLGQITGEADIRPDDWFLTCHFVDDRVMPGTLMYECCLHTLRVYLLRMGWVGEAGQVAYEPVPGIASTLKCRGQVTAATHKVQYEVTLKELGYQPDGTPFVIADALMYADGKPIVQMLNMSTRLTGLTRSQVVTLWQNHTASSTFVQRSAAGALFDTPRITAFATGKPSEAFGAPYAIFDPGQTRKIARLPGPPYQFLDRITRIDNCQPFKLAAGGTIEAQYDVPEDAWYFAANQLTPKAEMPFSILLEIALQPCGWLAAYLGSALVSNIDMRFRNLGGTATQFRPVFPGTGTLTTTVKITNVSNSGGMIIQHFDMAVRSLHGVVYQGSTYFGFFSKDALANQVGLRDAPLYQPSAVEIQRAQAFPFPDAAPFPNRQMRMIDHVVHFDPAGGPSRLGFIRGTTSVNPDAWFFKAHFFEDPVWPGSLGLESFLQLLKVVAHRRWGMDLPADGLLFQTLARGQKHSWIYRGQIIPDDRLVTVEAAITGIDDTCRLLRADGFLSVDNRIIYQMKDFALILALEGDAAIS